MFDFNNPAGGSGVTIQLIINGENATQQFQQFASQIEEKLNQFNKQVEKTNSLLTTAFNVNKLTNFTKKINDLTASVQNLNKELNNTPTEKLAALSGVPVTGAAKAESTKEGAAQASKVAASNKQIVDSYTQSFQSSFFQMMDKGFTQHTIAGTQSLIKTFGTAASWIGRIRVLAQSAVKMVINLIKSPFTLISSLLQKVSNAMGGIFKAFEWIQYQLFMQFMNIWLFSKTLMPVIQTFIDYNREIYQTWALIRTEWGDAFKEFNENLSSVDLSSITDDVEALGETLDNVLGKDRNATFVDMLSELGMSIAREYGKIPQDVASAFYQMASATMEFEDIADTAVLAAKASTAGVTDLTTAMDAGIQAAYAFGTEMSRLDEIYDLQFQTVKYGILRYKELADVMGRVYQPAASLSDSLANMQEMYATIAFATRVGLSPEMAGFGMGRLYESFSDARVVENLKKINVEVFDSIGNFRGLYAIVTDIVFTIKGFSTSVGQTILSNLGFDMRARRVLRSLITNFAAYTQIVDDFGNNIEGSMSRAFETMTESFSFKVDQFKATWETLKISISEASIDTLTSFLDTLSFGLKALIGWLQEGVLYINNFSLSIGSIVKYSATFFMMFAVIASFAGAIKAALTPTGLFVAAIIMLLRDAAKGGKIIQYLNQNFKGLASILNTVTDYIKIFVELLKEADTPISAFGKLLNMMFSDLNTIIFGDSGIASLKGIIDSFKSLFTSLKGVFDPKSYVEALDAFSDETGKFTTKIGTVIAYRFGNIFHAVGQALRDFVVAAFDIEEGSIGTVLGAAIQKTYRFIMDVFAGIFNKSPEDFGLITLFTSILEVFGILLQDQFGNLVLNKRLISSIGSTFAKLLGEVIKGYFTNFNLILTITGFNIAKEATFGLFRSLSAMQNKLIQSQTFGGTALSFVGDTLKYRAILEFVDVLLPPDLAEKLKGPLWEAGKWIIAAVVGYLTTRLRASLFASAAERMLKTTMQAATVTIHTPVVNIFTSSVNNTGVPASPFVPVAGKAASALSKTFILSMVGITVGALVGAGGLLSGLFGEGKKSPVDELSTQMQMQTISNNAISMSLRQVAGSISDSSKDTGDLLKAIGITAGLSVLAGLTAGTALPVIASVGSKILTGVAAMLKAGGALGAAGKISGTMLAGLAVGGTAAVNLLPFVASIKAKNAETPMFNLAELSAILQESYYGDYAEGLVFQGGLKPEYKDIMESIVRTLPVSKKVGAATLEAIDRDKLKDLNDKFLEKFILQYGAIAETIGAASEEVLDLTESIWSEQSFRDMTIKMLKEYPGTGVTYNIAGWVKSANVPGITEGSTFMDYIEAVYGTAEGLLDSIMATVGVPDESLVSKYTSLLMGMDRFYGTANVLKELSKIDFTSSANIDSMLASAVENLDKHALNIEDRADYMKTVNKLYITYFSDVIEQMEVAGGAFTETLLQDSTITSLLADVIGPTLSEGQNLAQVIQNLSLSEVLDYVQKLGASDKQEINAKARSALQKIYSGLQAHAGSLINITDHLEYFKLMGKLNNYLLFEEGTDLKEVYDLKNMLFELAMPTTESVNEITALTEFVDGIKKINDYTFSVDYWKDIIKKQLGSTAKAYAAKAIAETIATTIVNSILDSLETQAGVTSLGLGKVYSADTGIFMEGTKYATSFKDPFEVFSEFAVGQFKQAIGGESKIVSMTQTELFDTIKQFTEKTFPTEGLQSQAIINFNKAMQEHATEVVNATDFMNLLTTEFTTLARTYFSEDMAKFIEEFGESFLELDIMARSGEYADAFRLMFEGGVEEMKGVVSVNAELADNFISTAKAVQEALNTARRNLSSTVSVFGMSVSGASTLDTFREFSSKYSAFSGIFGSLFGQDSILATLYSDLSTGFYYGMQGLKAEARSYDFNQTADITDFVNANAQLLIDLGLLTQKQYLEVVATGLWENGGKIGSKIKTSLTKSKMQTILNTSLWETADQYVMFTERYMYLLNELGAIDQNSIAKMDIPELIDRVKGIAENFGYWLQNDVINLFDPANWGSVVSSGVDIGTIISTIATTTADNFMAIFSDPKVFESTYKSIFHGLTLDTGIARKYAMLSRMAVSAKGVGIPDTVDKILDKMSTDETFKTYVEAHVAALDSIEVAIKNQLIDNLQGLGKGLISQYIPEGVSIFETMLDIPILGGSLNILTGIASKFVGNYLFSLISDKATDWLLGLSSFIEGVNVGATGEAILSQEEIVEFSKNILVDGFTFVGSLLKLPFEMFTGKMNFEQFVSSLSLESVMPQTVGFINKLGEESKAIVSNWVVGGIKGLDILAPVGELLSKYQALDEKTEAEAVKLVEQQWGAIKTFVADVLGVKAWVINLLDIGLFRGGIINFIAKQLPNIEKVVEKTSEFKVSTSPSQDLGGRTQYTGGSKQTIPGSLEAFLQDVDVAIMEAVAYRVDRMLPLSITEIQKEASAKMQIIPGYDATNKAQWLANITRDKVRTQVSLLNDTLSELVINVGDKAISGLTMYNAVMSGFITDEKGKPTSPTFLTDIVNTAMTSTEAMETVRAELIASAGKLTPEARDKLIAFQNTFYTSMLPALTPFDIKRLFPAYVIPEEYLNLAGTDWASKSHQYAFLANTLSPEDQAKAIEYLSGTMQTFYDNMQNAGNAFASIGSSLEIGTEELGWGMDVLSKAFKTAGIVISSATGAIAGWEAIETWGANYQAVKTSGDPTKIISSIMGLAGGWGQLIGSVLQGVVSVIQIWKESQKITESQLIAIRQNTVAIESLTNILDSMRLTMYGAPSGFIYGYTNPMPDDFSTASTRGVTFNIEALNISGSGDPDEIAAAVEQGLVLAAKRIR
ncbi:MAG: phage tail tape measure protein [Clostridia bacterium]|jgi:TP901 family phage tail tape measure protein